MKNSRQVQFYSISLVSVLISSVLAQPVSSSLCGRRCFESVPDLKMFQNMWRGMSKRIGRDNLPFESFVQSLIILSNSRPMLIPLRESVLRTIEKYQKCMKACEHQHSKRTSERTSDSYIRPSICLAKNFCL